MTDLLGRPLVVKEYKKRSYSYYIGRVLVILSAGAFLFLSGYLCKALG